MIRILVLLLAFTSCQDDGEAAHYGRFLLGGRGVCFGIKSQRAYGDVAMCTHWRDGTSNEDWFCTESPLECRPLGAAIEVQLP